ncbi:FAD-linked oxidase [Rhodoferax koreense]|uniref:FAD-linked oxidase n=1 Tax=Rhodoferax koreensis TaxID=1842727 RepID=A0A1P8K0I2_9BURK|nr:FAD-binding oxidoreductase [Rhodoferax koreense]APW39502.1 FAD-linked oxidase [Rhodoferax koreense]
MTIEHAIVAWRKLLGNPQVLIGDDVSQRYGSDTTGQARKVPVALRISDSASLPEVMKIAHLHKVPVYPISTGRNWGYGSALPVRDGCVLLDLSPLQKILDFDAEFGAITLEPGVTQAMLADFLRQGNHPYLVPVTGAGPTCSLVGNALERGYGVTPHVDHFAAVTDLEAVLADGTLYKTALREAGGDDVARLFKWGIGAYSAGLFTQGGFGIVTRMTIILARKPECIKVCLFSLKDDALLEPAVERIRTILGRLPGIVGAINLMNQHRVLSMAAPFPRDRIGPDGLIPQEVITEMGRQYQIFPWTGFGTLYGTKSVVAAAQKEIKATLGSISTRMMFLTPGRARTLSKLARMIPGKRGKGLAGMTATLEKSLELVAGQPNETALPLAYWRNKSPQKQALKNPASDGCGLIWYAPLVPMRPAGIRAYVDMVKRVAPKHAIEPLITFTTLNDRLFDSTVPIIFERDQPTAVASAQACYSELLHSGREQGWFPYRVGVGTMDSLAKMQPLSSAFHKRLKAGLDPESLVAPGRYES